MARSSMHRCAHAATLLALVAGGIGAVPAAAQDPHAKIALSRDHALWSDTVEARVTATGCTGPAVPGDLASHIIDINLLGCSTGSTATYSTTLSLGPRYPGQYLIRLHDAGNPSPLLDTIVLNVHPTANLSVDVPAVVTDAAPFSLTFRGLTSSSCFFFEDPVAEGHVITAIFTDECPVLPTPTPGVFELVRELGPLPAGEYEVRFFNNAFDFTNAGLVRRTLVVHDADRCVPSDTALCLQGDRFKVEVAWKDFAGHQGVGHAIPLAEGDGSSGLLWFFQPDNVELTVKVLDGCDPAGTGDGSWWVFISSGTTVEYTLTVTDTATGAHKSYPHASGVQSPLVADTSAFSCDTRGGS